MKRHLLLLGALACCATISHAQTAPSAISPADSFNAALSSTEKQMMALVHEMPADKYTFAPSAAIFVLSQKTNYDGVRTFGALAIHVAQANYGMAARFSGLKPEVAMASLSSLKSKEEIEGALADSFTFVHKAIGTLTPENALQSVSPTNLRVVAIAANLAHTSDEYGQMVEYARMNGIVPPASGPSAPPKK